MKKRMITLGTGLMLGISLLYNPTATVVFAEETETMNETQEVNAPEQMDQKFHITVVQPEAGTVTLSSNTAKEGETVTVKVEQSEGIRVETVEVTDASVSKQDDNIYTFQMPARDVTVEVINQSLDEKHKVYISVSNPATTKVPVGTDWHEVVAGVTECKACGFKGSKENIRLISGSFNQVGSATLKLAYSEEHNGILHETTEEYTYTVIDGYNVYIYQEPEAGWLSVDKEIAKAGEIVTATVKPNQGYKVDAVRAYDNNAKKVSENTYTFEMPAENVTVFAIYSRTSFTTAVTNLKSVPAGKQKVKLTWNSAEGAEGYLVYAQKNGKYGYVGMTTKGTTFTDTKALDTDYNYYWVFPYVTDTDTGKMLPGKCTKYVWTKGVIPAVQNLKAFSAKSGVKLTWTEQKDAEGYLVYGQRAGGKYGYVVITTKGTTFTDTKASKTAYNYYWVFPYHKDGQGNMIVGGTPKYTYGRAL